MLSLPPLDTPGLSPSEKESIRIGATLLPADAAKALGITVENHNRRINAARQKHLDEIRKQSISPVPRMFHGILR